MRAGCELLSRVQASSSTAAAGEGNRWRGQPLARGGWARPTNKQRLETCGRNSKRNAAQDSLLAPKTLQPQNRSRTCSLAASLACRQCAPCFSSSAIFLESSSGLAPEESDAPRPPRMASSRPGKHWGSQGAQGREGRCDTVTVAVGAAGGLNACLSSWLNAPRACLLPWVPFLASPYFRELIWKTFSS